MSGLSPGQVLPKDMDDRQFATWCRAQGIEAVASDEAAQAIAAHVALPDPHSQYALDADLAALHITSGPYTPTITAVGNIDTTTAYSCQYFRVGSVVTVSGRVDVDSTATGLVTLGISLPIASNLTASNELAGTIAAGSSQVGPVYGDATNDRAEATYVSAGTVNQGLWFSFTYRVN